MSAAEGDSPEYEVIPAFSEANNPMVQSNIAYGTIQPPGGNNPTVQSNIAYGTIEANNPTVQSNIAYGTIETNNPTVQSNIAYGTIQPPGGNNPTAAVSDIQQQEHEARRGDKKIPAMQESIVVANLPLDSGSVSPGTQARACTGNK
jgi:hypothetical protein